MSLNNKVLLIGNVGGDPSVRYIDRNPNNQAKVATFTLATSEFFTGPSGERREQTDWHNIVAWRRLADVVERSVKKGTRLFIEGSIHTRSYEDKSGATRYITEIVADNIQIIERQQSEQRAPYPQTGGYQAPQGGYQASQGGYQAPQGGYQPQPAQQPQIQSQGSTPGASAYENTDDLPF